MAALAALAFACAAATQAPAHDASPPANAAAQSAPQPAYAPSPAAQAAAQPAQTSAPSAPAALSAQAPAQDALKQIIEEGDPADLDWPGALADRGLIAKLYASNGYRFLWSDGAKPTAAALSLIGELRRAGDRG